MVILRPLELDDVPAIYRAVDSSRDALRRWMVWYQETYSIKHAEAWIQYTIDSAASGAGFHFAIVADGDLVGVISVEGLTPDSRRGMLGYWMATRATGRGLGREAVAQVVAWARAQTNLATLWALVAEANIAQPTRARGQRVSHCGLT
jgi:ribosomal-protein-serine acetyltransferase